MSLAAFAGLMLSVPVSAQEDITQGVSNISKDITQEDYQLSNSSTINIEGGILNNSDNITEINNKHFDSNILSVSIDSEAAPRAKISVKGGLIYNTGDISDIKDVTFNKNKISLEMNNSGNYDYLNGGILYNKGNILNIENVTFADNEVSLHNPIYHTSMFGGLLYNEGTITKYSGSFIRNNIISPQAEENAGASQIYGALVFNNGNINNFKAEFIDNNKIQEAGRSGYQFDRGFVYNAGGIDNLDVTFINNKSSLVTDKNNVWNSGMGVLVYSSGANSYINNINATLNDNTTTIKTNGSNNYTGLIADVSSKGFNNVHINASNNKSYIEAKNGYAFLQAGILYAEKDMETFTGNFDSNIMQNHQKEIYDGISPYITTIGGIFKTGGKVNYLEGTFTNNYMDAISYSSSQTKTHGGVLSFVKDVNINNSLFDSNKIYTESQNGKTIAQGGAIYSKGLLNIRNSRFLNNVAELKSPSEDIAIEGGAIYSTKDINIVSDGGLSEFSGNKTISNGVTDDNAIYLANSEGTITFNQINNGKTILNDNIRGDSSEITETDEAGNETTTVKNYTVNITGDGTGTFGLYNQMYDANVLMGNINLDTVNNRIDTYNFNTLTLTGDVNATVDVDLANSIMDRLSANSYGEHNGTLNVSGMNLMSDSNGEKTEILFAEEGLKDNVATTVKEVAYSPIYKYDVLYDNRTDGGYFVFNRGAGSGSTNPSNSFNPAVLSSAVSSVAASQATINETFKNVFGQSDVFTQLPYAERNAKMNANKYALSTDFNNNLCALCAKYNNMSAWFKPYVTFESMDLRNGPRVNAKTYGSLAGFDTNFRELKRGWHSVGTGYVGYNGSQLSYSGVSTSMNGGLAGYTETFYKKNFWTAITLTAGASVGESHTMYGKEDFTTLMAGVGSKTGYNFEFKEGKYIIQPIMFMSYTFAKTFDYTNAAGVHVKPGAAHSLQLNPSVRFIANTKGGWQPYASVGMVWNVMNENKVMANDVRLPEMGMKPYVEYGVGLQRNWKDKFTAYGQAMLRNGGRNGIALTAGFRWAIGHEGEPVEKVQNSDKTRTVLKQLTPSQRWAQQKNTTRTTKAAVIKQMN